MAHIHSNGGLITVNPGDVVDGILVDNGAGGPAPNAATIVNNGTISSEAFIPVQIVSTLSDLVVNNGLITGTQNGIQGVVVQMGNGNSTFRIGEDSAIGIPILGGVGVDGGAGVNTLDFSTRTTGVTVVLYDPDPFPEFTLYKNFQNVIGSTGNDTVMVSADANTLSGGGGVDTLDFRYSQASVKVSLLFGAGIGGFAAGDHYSGFENIFGSQFGDQLFGDNGANLLSGWAGADLMRGGGGNDTYVLDNAGDIVDEITDGGGTDTVQSSVSIASGNSFAIRGAVEKFILTGTANIAATGNALANEIIGNSGNNILNGAGGIDIMRGLAGNDRYYVDNPADLIVEALNGGSSDIALVSTSYQLKVGVHVEQLTTTSSSGTAAINLVGNEFANTITGNAGNNLIDGKGGADLLRGYLGKDVFLFDTALGGGNTDTIADFNVADDQIRLSKSVFHGLALGLVSTSAFHVGKAAADSSDRIIYDPATGRIFFDDDGVGSHAAIHFATVTPNLSLTNADFFVA